MLFLNFEFRRGRPASGFAQLTRELPDGCAPHCLTDWRAMSRREAQALATREGATFRDQGAATP